MSISNMAAPIRQCFLTFCRGSTNKILRHSLQNKHNDFCLRRLLSTRELKKFYKNATVSQYEGWFEINLDQRKLRTPGGNLFRVPNEELALAVATEWNGQKKVVQRHSMHLTSLCNTALDNPMHKSRDDLIRGIIHFLETDTVSYRVTEPEALYALQNKEWDPVIQWVENRYEIEVPVAESIMSSPDLAPDTVHKLTRHMQSQNDWALFGYSYATEAIKSLVLVLALMDKCISVERCVELSRLEQDFQIEKWGNVEWYHDIDILELRGRLAASALFVHWSNETASKRSHAKLTSKLF
ncbi:ATP synthase mitochondrial F1 complex assembly factor 2-like [Mercenaria mercenaria]|uniref:ATP synthase mitochondrial F1 complex assembly factor 2-like n=1 Tax=Mercenaria mercenaria TaxID=6596 RepID=UPI00234EE3D6|nr:ATP synthase mitochondrial F1 complex assembly factor 2-like [Mercenaria mercenaria]